VWLKEAVVAALRRAGCEPLLLPPHDGTAEEVAALAATVLQRVDGLVITGGSFDIPPDAYGQAVTARLDRVDRGRTGLELALARAALARDLPLLGVCGGMQVMAVAAGGTLLQDIATARPEALEHEQPSDPATAWHPVHLEAGPLHAALGPGPLQVNSTHHQAVDALGDLAVGGRSPDGIVEVVFHPAMRFAVGVQWHPELLDDDAIYGVFADALTDRPPRESRFPPRRGDGST